MGLNLRGILAPNLVQLSDLRGETAAVDAYGLFYQFLTTLRDGQGKLLTDANDHVVSHLIGLIGKTEELLNADVLPVYVFDGKPHELKLEELRRRSELKSTARTAMEVAKAAGDMATVRKLSAQTAYVSDEMVADACAFLDAAGLPYVMAPQDAESQCAYLNATGQVHAAASQDYDTIVYGAQRTLRNLNSSKRDTEEILFACVQMETGLDKEGLVDVAILVGNDFHDGVKGVGAKTAMKLVVEHGGLDRFYHKCDHGYQPSKAIEKKVLAARDELVSDHAFEVRDIFSDPVVDKDVHVRPGRPDASALHERLREVHGFSAGRSDRFGTSVLEYFERRQAPRQATLA